MLSDATLEHTLANQAHERVGTGDRPEWLHIPPVLHRFVSSLDLRELARAIQQGRPWLYWHPLVAGQLMHMLNLCVDPKEWRRLRWKPRPPLAGTSVERSPKQVAEVRRELLTLQHAYVKGLGEFLHSKPRLQRGPKPKVLSPSDGGSLGGPISIDDQLLDESFRVLVRFFKKVKKELRVLPKEAGNHKRTLNRIRELVRRALDESSAAEWSDRRRVTHIEEPRAETSAAQREALSTDEGPSMDLLWTLECEQDVTWEWDLPSLTKEIKPLFLPISKGLVKSDGRPAYLAYVTLGALLDLSPTQVADRLRNSRRSSRSMGGQDA